MSGLLASGKLAQGALQPIEINLEKEWGVHYDPNAWMLHEVARET